MGGLRAAPLTGSQGKPIWMSPQIQAVEAPFGLWQRLASPWSKPLSSETQSESHGESGGFNRTTDWQLSQWLKTHLLVGLVFPSSPPPLPRHLPHPPPFGRSPPMPPEANADHACAKHFTSFFAPLRNPCSIPQSALRKNCLGQKMISRWKIWRGGGLLPLAALALPNWDPGSCLGFSKGQNLIL